MSEKNPKTFKELIKSITLQWFKMGFESNNDNLECVKGFIYYWISFNSLFNRVGQENEVDNIKSYIKKVKFNLEEIKNISIEFNKESIKPFEYLAQLPVLNLKGTKHPFYYPEQDNIIEMISNLKIKYTENETLSKYVCNNGKKDWNFYNELQKKLVYESEKKCLSVNNNGNYLELEFGQDNEGEKKNQLLFHSLKNFYIINSPLSDDEELREALIMIIYQIRNNLVHGNKPPESRDLKLVSCAKVILGKILEHCIKSYKNQ